MEEEKAPKNSTERPMSEEDPRLAVRLAIAGIIAIGTAFIAHGQNLTAINFGATLTSAPVGMNGKLFFAARDSAHGEQLWESDGTSGGTSV